MPFRTAAIAAIAVMLAVMAPEVQASCSPVSSDNADVPAEAVAVYTGPAAGVRVWDCSEGQLVNASQTNGYANLTAAAAPWTGGFYYVSPDVAVWTLKNGTAAPFAFTVSNAGFTPKPDALADARWDVAYLDDNVPASFQGEAVYWTRTESKGGVTPEKCPTVASKNVTVPFTATYTMYVCGAAVPSGAVSATFGALAAAVVALAALF